LLENNGAVRKAIGDGWSNKYKCATVQIGAHKMDQQEFTLGACLVCYATDIKGN